MSRCVICNHCNEIDGGSRRYKWSDEEYGFVCNVCNGTIQHTIYYGVNNNDIFFDEEGNPTLDFPLLDGDWDLDESEVLEVRKVEDNPEDS